MCDDRGIRALKFRLFQIDTKQFWLVLYKLLLEGLLKIELFSSIYKEDLLGVQFVSLKQFAVNELLNIALGRYLEVTDQLLPLQTLDVQVDEILMNIVQIDQMHNTLLL